MGLESYIIMVSFRKPLDQGDIISVFQDSGATFLKDKSNTEPFNDYRNWYFEIRSHLGLTEINVLLPPNYSFTENFTIRFSILSPSTVIDQTLDFLSKLKLERSLIIFDSENSSKIISVDIADFKANKDKIKKRQIIINNKTGLIIEGGSATTDYIHKNNLINKIWGQT